MSNPLTLQFNGRVLEIATEAKISKFGSTGLLRMQSARHSNVSGRGFLVLFVKKMQIS